MLALGVKQSQLDHSLFIQGHPQSQCSTLIVNVSDILVVSKNSNDMQF